MSTLHSLCSFEAVSFRTHLMQSRIQHVKRTQNIGALYSILALSSGDESRYFTVTGGFFGTNGGKFKKADIS